MTYIGIDPGKSGADSLVLREAIHFRVPCIPVAQPRQQHTVRHGHAVNYMPTKHPVNAYKAAVQQSVSSLCTGVLDGPLNLTMRFVLPRPKGMMWKSKPMPRVPHASRGDLDNFAKSTLDAMNGLVFRDDAQVCQGEIWKWYCSKEGQDRPGATITIRELT